MGKRNQLFTAKELAALTPAERAALSKRVDQLIKASKDIGKIIAGKKAAPAKKARKK